MYPFCKVLLSIIKSKPSSLKNLPTVLATLAKSPESTVNEPSALPNKTPKASDKSSSIAVG